MTFDGKAFAKTLSNAPGVYLMRDAKGKPLYVGKAANLRKRVSSYFDGRDKGVRLDAMIRRIRDVEVSLTRTEAEALLLENEWIKALRPRYNIDLRDDKSYPWIRLTSHQQWPRMEFYRGGRKEPGEYFGPFASAGAVRSSLELIYRVFRIRQCKDSVFANRSRPCLQYQINRCTAPCVGYIGERDYAEDVDAARRFLAGESQTVLDRLAERMHEAAGERRFEDAARLRDQIRDLSRIGSRQFVTGDVRDIDVIAMARAGKQVCVQVVIFRQGHNVGAKTYFPGNLTAEDSDAEVIAAFLGQYYAERVPPPEILLSQPPREASLWQQALGAKAKSRVRIVGRPRGERRQRVEMARTNAADALRRRLSEHDHVGRGLEALAGILDLSDPPRRLECFDISHTTGGQTVASCVVFGREGADKSQYRRYNIRDITPGDDYAAMEQALARRFRSAGDDDAPLPDLLIVDGGKGQVSRTHKVLSGLGLENIPVMGVAKGPLRRPGYETWIFEDGEMKPGPDHPASHLIQQIRDEAHRFAITAHRKRRQKKSGQSPLERIPGIGPRRRQALLNHFGGLKELKAAGVEELSSVPGISRKLAEAIYQAFHHR